MNQTLPTCARCSTSFWPSGRLAPDPRTHLCDSCVPEGMALSSDPSFSSNDMPEIIRSRPNQSTQQPAGDRVKIEPRRMHDRNLPGKNIGIGGKTRPTPTPAAPQLLAFNCPACMSVLNISRDMAIAGTTAPCPHCASMIIPPRIAPSSAANSNQRPNWRPER